VPPAKKSTKSKTKSPAHPGSGARGKQPSTPAATAKGSKSVKSRAASKVPAKKSTSPAVKSPAKSPQAKPASRKDATGKSNGNKSGVGKVVAGKVVAGKPIVASKAAGSKVSPSAKSSSPKKTAPSKKVVAKPTAVKTAPQAKGPTTKGTRGSRNTESKTENKKDSKAKASPAVIGTATAKHKAIVSKSPAAKPAPPPAIARPIAARPIAAKRETLPVPPKSNTNPEIVAKIRSAHEFKEKRKDLAQEPPKRTLAPLTPVPPAVKGQDRIVLMVHDPYWLHAHWDITRQTVDRAKAALVEHWHSVKPILRLLKLDDSGTTDSSETIYRDIEIHGGVRNWYVDVDNPPSRFQIVMGYLTASGRFYELVRSNTVVTPTPGGKEASDDHWADIAKDAERIYAMSGGYGDETQRGDLSDVFEDRLKRTMDIDVLSQFGSGAEGGLKRSRQFYFDVDAELIVFGSTHPDAHVTIGTEPVKVRNDGTFSIRLPFPDRRQVLPATAKSRDGVDEQTVVIAVERNTKVMEPLSMDSDEP